jgi:hypothetical protein
VTSHSALSLLNLLPTSHYTVSSRANIVLWYNAILSLSLRFTTRSGSPIRHRVLSAMPRRLKLTDTQLVLLSAGAQHPESAIELASDLKDGAAKKAVGKSCATFDRSDPCWGHAAGLAA